MDIQQAIAKTMQEVRKKQGFSQEDFSDVSSRTYLSLIERGLRNPTLEKLDQLSSVMEVHPLTMLTLIYLKMESSSDLNKLQKKITKEIEALASQSVR